MHMYAITKDRTRTRTHLFLFKHVPLHARAADVLGKGLRYTLSWLEHPA